MRAQTPSPNSVPLGTTTAAREEDVDRLRLESGAGLLAQLPHDELQEEQRGFGGLFVFGEIALDALLLLAAERRIREDHVHAVAFADVRELDSGESCRDRSAAHPSPCRSRFI